MGQVHRKYLNKSENKSKPIEIKVTPKKRKIRRHSSDSAFSSGCGGTPVS